MSLAREAFNYETKHISCEPSSHQAAYLLEKYVSDSGMEDDITYGDFVRAVSEIKEKYLEWTEHDEG